MIRRLSVAADAPGALERVSSASRPLGLHAGETRYALLRETYFDTYDGALAEERLSLCLRMEADGGQVLELARTASSSLGGVVELSVTSAPVVHGSVYAALRGDSVLAAAVRAAVDPAALRPILALDIDRESRELRQGMWGRTVCTAHFDRTLAHGRGRTRSLNEIVFTEEEGILPGLESLARELERQHGLVPDGRSTVQRALAGLGRDQAGPGEASRQGQVVLLAHRAGSIALVPGERGLTLPCAAGSGEAGAAQLARETLGIEPAAGAVELVGFTPCGGRAGDMEVWLHPCPGGTRPAGGVVWVSLADLMERLGNPGLRDAALVASLLLLVRSDPGQRFLAEASRHRKPAEPLPSLARPAQAAPGEGPEDFLTVELSILAFNQRVLELAEDPDVPLLDRFRFLSIFAGAMDEFFGVRVGRLRGVRGRAETPEAGDLTPSELLDIVAVRARALAARHYACLGDLLLPALAVRGVRLRTWSDLGPEARGPLSARFDQEIFPLLTPRAMSRSPGQPFPRLESLALSLAAVLRGPGSEGPQLAHVPVPPALPRFLPVPGSPDFIPVEEVIAAHAGSLFPGCEISGVHAFRVSRMGDVEIDEGAARSLLAAVEDEVEARPYKPVVRIEVRRDMPSDVLAFLLRELRQERGLESVRLGIHDVIAVDGPLDLRAFGQLAESAVPDETYPPFTPTDPWADQPSVFDMLRRGDRLVHHPYESFDASVGRFLREAADDPDVVALMLTLYRTGRDSPFGEALLQALRKGKEVSVFVELKARFDEESNIEWTRRIAEAGGHVVYGVVGFKTHAKAALVVRREGGSVRRYVHLGTGNYNAASARVYTDLSLLSADPDLGADLNDFFNELTGSAGPPVKQYRRLLVAPGSLARTLLALVEREAAHAAAGRPARIQAKLNGLTDRSLVRALYQAAAQGVQVDLIVRAVCTLRPGIPGLSQGIRVRSILGRFLEHARIYHFANGGEGEYYIASADWRKRNLRKRVELAVPVVAPDACARLRAILDAELADPRAWVLLGDGSYARQSDSGPTAQERFAAAPRSSLSSWGTRP